MTQIVARANTPKNGCVTTNAPRSLHVYNTMLRKAERDGGGGGDDDAAAKDENALGSLGDDDLSPSPLSPTSPLPPTPPSFPSPRGTRVVGRLSPIEPCSPTSPPSARVVSLSRHAHGREEDHHPPRRRNNNSKTRTTTSKIPIVSGLFSSLQKDYILLIRRSIRTSF